MFKNMKIGMRLGLGFALVVVVLVATLGVSAFRMGQLNTAISGIVEQEFPKTVFANQIIYSEVKNTHSQFAWNAGLGVEYKLNTKISIGVIKEAPPIPVNPTMIPTTKLNDGNNR